MLRCRSCIYTSEASGDRDAPDEIRALLIFSCNRRKMGDERKSVKESPLLLHYDKVKQITR
jgi:hypothetical protein